MHERTPVEGWTPLAPLVFITVRFHHARTLTEYRTMKRASGWSEGTSLTTFVPLSSATADNLAWASVTRRLLGLCINIHIIPGIPSINVRRELTRIICFTSTILWQPRDGRNTKSLRRLGAVESLTNYRGSLPTKEKVPWYRGRSTVVS